jgi:hypothetical protein
MPLSDSDFLLKTLVNFASFQRDAGGPCWAPQRDHRSTYGGIVPSEGIQRPRRWKELDQGAMLESGRNREDPVFFTAASLLARQALLPKLTTWAAPESEWRDERFLHYFVRAPGPIDVYHASATQVSRACDNIITYP